MTSFKTTLRVNWVDTDAAEVVHFSNYFRFFERAEEEFYRHLGLTFQDIREHHKIWLPRIEAFCKYKAPARFNDLLTIELVIEEIREKSIKYGFYIRKNETSQLLAEGYVVIVAADKDAGAAVKIPAEITEKLKAFTQTQT
ncbi:MAG: thioesterase family protein [Candidatus Bathyarchaeia archaeon]